MIQLTRLNNQPIMVNSELIKFVENAPDTVLTLISGEKIIVLESCDAVLQKVIAFRRSILVGLQATASVPSAHSSTISAGPLPLPTKPEER
ncbi:MAG: flagellar FlbD family protein [Candidatus Acidiferrum sp.]|jgi:flagellar protein FlbD